MKRDIDLARALLFDIESEEADCPINRLRLAPLSETAAPVGVSDAADTTDRVRYHLRLLIDGGLVKEIDRTTAGVPCVRLTNAGHEMVELTRSDALWRDAKRCCRDTTGGLSLTVIRALLTKWAVAGSGVGLRRRPRAYRTLARPYYHRVEPRRRYDGYRYDYREPLVRQPVVRERLAEADDLRLVRTGPDYRERLDDVELGDVELGAEYAGVRYRGDYYGYERAYDRDYTVAVDRNEYAVDADEAGVGVSLPIYLV